MLNISSEHSIKLKLRVHLIGLSTNLSNSKTIANQEKASIITII